MKRVFNFLLSLALIGLLAACVGKYESVANLPAVEPEPTKVQYSPIALNQGIYKEDIGEFTLTSALIYNEIELEYIDYSPKPGLKRLIYAFDVKSLNPKEMLADRVIDVKVTYEKKFEYEASDWLESGQMTNVAKLVPLKETAIFVIVDVPDEVAEGPGWIDTEIRIDDEYFIYTGEIVPVYDYINQMKALHQPYIDAVEDFYREIQFSIVTSYNAVDEVIEKNAMMAGLNELTVSTRNSVVSISPVPSVYQSAHDKYVEALYRYEEAFGMGGNPVFANNPDLNEYANTLETISPLFDMGGALIEEALVDMPFLEWD